MYRAEVTRLNTRRDNEDLEDIFRQGYRETQTRLITGSVSTTSTWFSSRQHPSSVIGGSRFPTVPSSGVTSDWCPFTLRVSICLYNRSHNLKDVGLPNTESLQINCCLLFLWVKDIPNFLILKGQYQYRVYSFSVLTILHLFMKTFSLICYYLCVLYLILPIWITFHNHFSTVWTLFLIEVFYWLLINFWP